MQEELGILPSTDDVLGALDDYPTRSGYLIAPVVVWVPANVTIVPNPAEVARAYKPQPEAYLRSAALLDLAPAACMMVAAHGRDLIPVLKASGLAELGCALGLLAGLVIA